MYTCETCKARSPLHHVSAHYGWCKEVGGAGFAPNSWQGMQAKLRQDMAEAAAREAEDAERRRSNNGWVKYKGEERSYDHLRVAPQVVFESELGDVVSRVHRDSTPVSQHTEDGYLTRPGRELPKYWRQIALRLIDEQGWTYRYKRKGGSSHPRIIPPEGGLGVSLPSTVTEGHTGHRASYLTALKRAGARLDGAA